MSTPLQFCTERDILYRAGDEADRCFCASDGKNITGTYDEVAGCRSLGSRSHPRSANLRQKVATLRSGVMRLTLIPDSVML